MAEVFGSRVAAEDGMEDLGLDEVGAGGDVVDEGEGGRGGEQERWGW